jgi:hypothetical protein
MSIARGQPLQVHFELNKVSEFTRWSLEHVNHTSLAGPRFSDLLKIYNGQNATLKTTLSLNDSGQESAFGSDSSLSTLSSHKWYRIVLQDKDFSRGEEDLFAKGTDRRMQLQRTSHQCGTSIDSDIQAVKNHSSESHVHSERFASYS